MTDQRNPFRSNPVKIGKFEAEFRRSAADAAAYFGLSPRELEVLDCLAVGMSGPEAAEKMKVTVNTMTTY